jgi:hypothetical protein
MHLILLLAFFQAPVATEPLRSGCSPDDSEIAAISAADAVEVQGAVAGGGETCYKIAVTRQGQRLIGYVLGEGLPAIAAFERRRRRFDEDAGEVRALAAPPPMPTPASTEAPKPKAAIYFENFTARDADGNPFSLYSLNGRVTLVNFWSPRNPSSIGQIPPIMALYTALRGRGLSAVGVSMDPNPSLIKDALDAMMPTWPQVPDRDGLAARYRVNSKTGGVLVLDSEHRIVASGPMGPEIENKVRQLLAAPPPAGDPRQSH